MTRNEAVESDTSAAAYSRESALLSAVVRHPEDVSASLALASFLSGQDRDRDAAAVYRQILEDHPDDGEALCKLGVLLHLYPAFQEEAVELLQRAISLDSTLAAAYRPLASTLDQQGRRSEAVAVLRAWCAAAPLDAVASHLLAAFSAETVPQRATDAFVQQTFDLAAERFDQHLRDTLQYRAPEALSAHLGALLPASTQVSLDILDMGCGTGLCAPLLRPWARTLTGVDLSSGMLAKAREGGLYDGLEAAELTAYLAQRNHRQSSFDVLFAADTLVYFGQLDALFLQAFAALRPGGWLAFTVERLSPSDRESVDARNFILDTTGRYKHSAHYVKQTLANAGFLAPHLIEAPVRLESGEPEIGLVVAAMKPERQ